MFAFDFDETISQYDGDRYIFSLLPDGKVPQSLEEPRMEKGKWNLFMKKLLIHFHEQGIPFEKVKQSLETLPIVDGMKDLFHNLGEDIIIISNSNQLFIEWSLAANDMYNYVRDVYTNKAQITAQGLIDIGTYCTHQCKVCPFNMCKFIALSEYLEKSKKGQIEYGQVCYVGDGLTDLCILQSLQEKDICFIRNNYPLHNKYRELVSADPQTIKC